MPRIRVHPTTGDVAYWVDFESTHATLEKKERLALWRKLPRVRRTATLREYMGRAFTWIECVHRFRDYEEMTALYTWFKRLPRME